MVGCASTNGHAAVVVGPAGGLVVPVANDVTLVDLSMVRASFDVAQSAELAAGIFDARVTAASVGGAPRFSATAALAAAAVLSATAALAARVVRLRVSLAGRKANRENTQGQEESEAEFHGVGGGGMSDHFCVVVVGASLVHAATFWSEVRLRGGLLACEGVLEGIDQRGHGRVDDVR